MKINRAPITAIIGVVFALTALCAFPAAAEKPAKADKHAPAEMVKPEPLAEAKPPKDAGKAVAKEPAAPVDASKTPISGNPKATAATNGYTAAITHLRDTMTVDYTGDTDSDYLKSMVPLYEGGIELAKIQLKFSKDDATKKLAETMLKEQTTHLAAIKSLLEKTKK